MISPSNKLTTSTSLSSFYFLRIVGQENITHCLRPKHIKHSFDFERFALRLGLIAHYFLRWQLGMRAQALRAVVNGGAVQFMCSSKLLACGTKKKFTNDGSVTLFFIGIESQPNFPRNKNRFRHLVSIREKRLAYRELYLS